MYIKIHDKPSGIPRAEVAAADGERDDGQHQVTMFIKALDSHEISTVVASLRLSPQEAKDLGEKLIDESGLREYRDRTLND